MFILRSPFESAYAVRNLHRVVIPRPVSNRGRLIQNRTDHCGGIQNQMWEVQQGGSLRQRAVDNDMRIFAVDFPVVVYDGVLGSKCYGWVSAEKS